MKAYFWGTNWDTSRFEAAQSSYLIDSNPFPSVLQPGQKSGFLHGIFWPNIAQGPSF
jgi:hypothetical protein